LRCRTIYFDAATRFYKSNTFEFTMDYTLDANKPIDKACQMWLKALGSQGKWVKKVHLNARGFVSGRCNF
jgi:hypothetical protein